MAFRILIVDDDVSFCGLLGRLLSLEGYIIFKSFDINSSSEILKKNKIDMVLLDINLPDGNGAIYTREIKARYPDIRTIILTAYSDINSCVTAIKNGAIDYFDKGGLANKIVELVKEKLVVEKENSLKKHLSATSELPFTFNNIIGESESIQGAISLAKKVSQTNASVLLLGETGTGKELFARAIHQSRSGTDPFVAINCSSFSRNLLESELFGYKAGTFTGAVNDKKGLIEAADGGTLFLDEIGEMDKDLQARFLRILEVGEYIKLGDTKTQRVNFRLISATNKDLAEEVKKGSFREDLFYRLNIFTIQLPSLRSRKNDIPMLAEYYIKIFSQKLGKNIEKMNKDFENIMINYNWKGNIRELKNIIERAVILSNGPVLTEDCLPYEILSYRYSTEENNSSEFDIHVFEKLHIKKVLFATNWDKSKAAKLLNISVSTLYRKIEDLMLDNSMYK